MEKTRHATIRFQQRGFQNNHIDLIVKYGIEKKKPGNVIEFRLSKKGIIRAINEAHKKYKRTIQDLDKCKNKGVLYDPETNTIITVYNIRRKQKSYYPDLAA